MIRDQEIANAGAWLVLLGASILEMVWAIALKQADGFTRFWPGVIGIVAAAASFYLLALALKGLPVGTAYAVWTGIGAAGTAALGIVLLGEPLTLLRVTSIALVIIGIAGLRLSSP